MSAVVDLWHRCFPYDLPSASQRLERYVTELFLDNPWRDADLPSLVYEDGEDRVIGFLGVVPRPMAFEGAPLRTATASRLMVEPGRRGVAALRLLQRFLAAPHDLAIADVATPESRALWERLGGTTAVAYSLEWFRPLAPARAALGWLGHVSRSRAVGVAARTVGRAVDAALVRAPGSPFRRVDPPVAGEPLGEDALLECLGASEVDHRLAPRYTAASLRWLLRMTEEKLHGVRAIRVHDRREAIGWYVYGLDAGRHVAQVLRLAAAPGRFGEVLAHLLDDAARHGGAAVADRLAPRLLREMNDRLCLLRRTPWVLVHSRSAPVLDAIARGDAVLSRMEGEWWMPP